MPWSCRQWNRFARRRHLATNQPLLTCCVHAEYRLASFANTEGSEIVMLLVILGVVLTVLLVATILLLAMNVMVTKIPRRGRGLMLVEASS